MKNPELRTSLYRARLISAGFALVLASAAAYADPEPDNAPSATSEASAKTHQAVASTKRVASDSWITTKVKSEILADSVSKGFKVGVTTTHGVVVLKGSLPSQDAVDHVKDIAGQVKGVKSVDTTALVVASS